MLKDIKKAYAFRRNVLVVICLLIIFTQSGCATLGAGVGGIFGIIGQIIGGVFNLAGKALDIVARMPKPPPGIF